MKTTRIHAPPLYGPLEPYFDKTWRLGEIEKVK
jgi:hypothetical protein